MELLSLKIIILTLSGVVRLIFGMLPMVLMRSLTKKFRKDSKLKTVISLLMFFGGGVLLATCFLHMMPEVRESFQCAVPDSSLPVAEMIFIGGFFMVYMLEDVIHSCIDRRRRNHKPSKSKKEGANSKNNQSKNSGDDHHNHDQENISSNNNPCVDDRAFQANVNGAYQSTGDITASGFLSHRDRQAQLENSLGTRAVSYHGSEVPPPVSVPIVSVPVGGVNVLPRLNKDSTPDYNINNIHHQSHHQIQQNNMKNDPQLQPSHFGVEKFSYVDPDWWRDTVIANSQMNLLSNSSFSVASAGAEHGGKDLIDNQSIRPRNCQAVSPSSSMPLPLPKGSESPISSSSETCSSSGRSTTSTTDSPDPDSGHHCHSHHVPITGSDEEDTTIGGSIRNLLIVIAISFHGIFEGLAIGLQPTAKDLWYLFLAVSLHECTILFCIGVELISSKTRVFRMITYILVVSLVNPIGIAIGIIVSENSFSDVAQHALIVGSFQGLAAGTLLYVTFFEIFASEGKNLKTKGFHILTAMMGFILMASLELIGGHNHSHKCSSHSHSHASSLNGNRTLDGHGDHDHDAHAPTGFHSHEEDHHHDHDHSH